MSAHELLTRSPTQPPPTYDGWRVAPDGTRLYAAFDAPEGSLRGVVWEVLGPEIPTNDPYPRFHELARGAGLASAVFHPRGAGYSDGPRGDTSDYEQMLAECTQFGAHLRAAHSSLPLFLLGHSVGGPLALEIARRSSFEPAGLVLINPAFRLARAEGMRPSAGDYVRYAANMVFRRAALTADMNRNPEAIAHDGDRAEAEAMQRDPLVVRWFSMRYLLAQKRVMDRAAENAAVLSAPLLLVQGECDALVDPRGNEELLAASPSLDKQRCIAPAAGHGASAVERAREEIVAWLTRHADEWARHASGSREASGGASTASSTEASAP